MLAINTMKNNFYNIQESGTNDAFLLQIMTLDPLTRHTHQNSHWKTHTHILGFMSLWELLSPYGPHFNFKQLHKQDT